jgi:glycosyltransferase involved in cell wall biosynthesis
MSDVLLTAHTPALDSGHGLRTYAVARALAVDDLVEVRYVQFGAAEPAPEYRDPDRFRLERLNPSRGAGRALLYARARAAGVPRRFARGISPELVAAGRGVDGRLVADGPVVGAALLVGGRRERFAYSAHNMESDFRASVEARDLGTAKQLRRFERRLLRLADESWMVSERDMRLAAELCPQARLRLVPNAVDVGAIVPLRPDSAARRAVFIGSFSYEPNARALRFLLDDVMPLVWEREPEARLRLAGGGLKERPSGDTRVEALGYVEHVADAYAGCTCAVVPLLEGGGSPLKFIEALAYGLPVVATPKAAAGLELRAGRDYVEGGDAPAFAAALARVLADGGRGLGAEGRRTVERLYSIEAVARALRD